MHGHVISDVLFVSLLESSLLAGGSGAQNFITGAGGFLQCVWAGLANCILLTIVVTVAFFLS